MRLFSDPRGTLAGWVSLEGTELVMQVYDQADGTTRTFPMRGARPPRGAVLLAINGRTAYWRNEVRAGVFAVDVETGQERLVASGEDARNLEIFSAEDGVLAFGRRESPRDNLTSISVGRSIEDAREFTFDDNAEASDLIRLSPTGAWLSYLLIQFDGPPRNDAVLAMSAQIRDTNTGGLITLDIPAPRFTMPVVWLDDTTVQVLAVVTAPGNSAPTAHMYECALPDGSCTAAADLSADVMEGDALVLPTGRSVAD